MAFHGFQVAFRWLSVAFRWLSVAFGGFCFGVRFIVFYELDVFDAGIFLFFDPEEGQDGAMVLAVEAVLLGVAGIVSKRAHGKHGSGQDGLAGRRFGLTAHGVGDGGGFDGPRTEEKPLVDADFFDEGALAWGLRREFVVEGVEELGETLAGLAFDKDGVGQDVEFSVVAAGGEVFWTGRFLRIGTVRGEAFV